MGAVAYPLNAEKLELVATAGHYVAVRIGFAFPLYEENALPQPWVDTYTAQGFMLSDPIVRWMYQNTGSERWSALKISDPRDVLTHAKSHNLRFGVVVCCLDPDSSERSFGSFARADREFTDEEILTLSNYLFDLHAAKKRPSNLTSAELEALRFVRDGLRFKQIAHLLSISESAVKARLTNAKKKLKAKTSAQAVTRASEHGLL